MSNPTSPLQHLAFIMDGNRRWAKNKGLPSIKGHSEGAETLRNVTELAGNMGIPYITFYALSTENLKGRSPQELKHIFALMERMKKYLKDLKKNDIQMRLIGNIEALPEKTRDVLKNLVKETKHHKKLILTLAVNYGGRDEIVRAAKKLLEKKLRPAQVTEEIFAEQLDTKGIPDVDMVIRTGGDQRLSNYLPWQNTYAELYFTPTYWPAFDEKEFQKAINWFLEQKRNRGK